jgi:hypothetical protein
MKWQREGFIIGVKVSCGAYIRAKLKGYQHQFVHQKGATDAEYDAT